MMSLRLIEPERPGFDSRTFECPKCYDAETFVVSISCEVDVSIAPSHQWQHCRLDRHDRFALSSNMCQRA
jgi:hypothetical protein